jgi:hypothetical protein
LRTKKKKAFLDRIYHPPDAGLLMKNTKRATLFHTSNFLNQSLGKSHSDLYIFFQNELLCLLAQGIFQLNTIQTHSKKEGCK